MEKAGLPTLTVGSSHVVHLQSYLQQRSLPSKLHLAFAHTKVGGVGSTTWNSLTDHIQGINLSDRNKELNLGDQWAEIKATYFKPRDLVLVCGSNAVDKVHTKFSKVKIKEWPCTMYWKHATAQLNSTYKKAVKNIDDALLFFTQQYPVVELLYFNILPRCWWGYYA